MAFCPEHPKWDQIPPPPRCHNHARIFCGTWEPHVTTFGARLAAEAKQGADFKLLVTIPGKNCSAVDRYYRQDKTMFYLESYTVLCISTWNWRMVLRNSFNPARRFKQIKRTASFDVTTRFNPIQQSTAMYNSHILNGRNTTIND